MLYSKLYISLLDFYRFDREHYVIGQNENMLRIKVKQYGNDGRSRKIKYRDYWADHILQRECQSITYAKVTEGIIDKVIHGFDSIILACGPHCSGKTFNITGWNRKYEGIAPRMIEEMFTMQNRHGGVSEMSCVEIKDNRVFDLLNDSNHPCLMKDVSRHKIDSSQSAKNKLWEANAKRTAVEEKEGLPSHFYDFVITIYYSREQLEEIADAKCAKVRIVELAGVGPNTSKSLKHQIRANQTMLELSQLLEHVVNVNTKDNRDSIKKHGSSTLTLLKYCEGSFTKQQTVLRVICHIRPELEFFDSNLSVLKLGEALQKLPSNVISLSITDPKKAEEQKQNEHLRHELRLYESLKGHERMANMTSEHFVQLRTKVLNFLQFKNDDIVLLKWNHADVFTILSVFKEYYNKQSVESNDEEIANHFEYAPFPLTSTLIDPHTARQTTDDLRQTISEVLAPLSIESLTKQSYWKVFEADNSQIFHQKEALSVEIYEAHRRLYIDLGNMLVVQERLIKIRDRMENLRRKRHFYGSEQYDSNMNIIVPVEERNLFVNIRQVDIEMTKANDDFNQELKYLNQTLSTYSGLNDETHLRFEESLKNQMKSQSKIEELKTEITSKAPKNTKNMPKRDAGKSTIMKKKKMQLKTSDDSEKQ